MLNRRGFLAALGAFAAAAALDPERALWVRGAKLVSIPKPAPLVTTGWAAPAPFMLAVGDIVTFGDWPERYVVTAPSGSIERISDARFVRVPAKGGRNRFENRIGDTVFETEHLCFANGPSRPISRRLMTLLQENMRLRPVRLKPSTHPVR